METRRDIHAHPELRYEERRTAGLAAARLATLGYEVRTGVAGTGVVGLLRGAGPGPTVMIRSDMDALPIQEETDLPYRSTRPGVMHACGHDAHTAIGLGVARRLAARRDWRGAVKMVFQPAEEGGVGARRMIEEGVLEDPAVDCAYALHVWNDLDTGTASVSPGPVMASVDEFAIMIRGRGGHAGRPHQSQDPVVCAAHVITALQTIASRNASPLENVVVSVTTMAGGSAFNVIPDRVELRGTVRTFGGVAYDLVPRRLEEIARGVAQALGCEASVNYERQSPVVTNDGVHAVHVRDQIVAVLGKAGMVPDLRSMGGEDFGCFLERVPGCLFFLGVRNRAKGIDAPLHSPRFQLDEDALPLGVEILERVARGALA